MNQTDREPNYSARAAAAWLGLVLALATVPLAIAMIPPLPAKRAFAVEFGVTLGFAGMGLLSVQFLFSGRFAAIAGRFGTDNVLQLHRQLGLVGFLLVLAHPLVLVLADPDFLVYFDPRVNVLRAVALAYVTTAVTALVVTTLWRERFRLSYEWWRLVHGLLALSIVFTGVVHGIQVGHYLAPLHKQVLWAGFVAAAMYLVVHSRLVRPARARRRPYRVAAVDDARGEVTVLTLEPDGHEGLRYEAGQFAWITLRDSPFALQQHPFSFVSAADEPRVQFAAKEVGDFTSTWKDLAIGARAYLEGPFGGFTRKPSPTAGLFLVVGGIGVTPAISLLRTMRAQGARHPATLVYANDTWEEVAFRDELGTLARELPLEVVHVLAEPPDDWTGERGLLTQEMLARHLPPRPNDHEYFLCGPEPLMDVAEKSLRALGVDWRRIYSERFQIV